jgi:hypothetical protein
MFVRTRNVSRVTLQVKYFIVHPPDEKYTHPWSSATGSNIYRCTPCWSVLKGDESSLTSMTDRETYASFLLLMYQNVWRSTRRRICMSAICFFPMKYNTPEQEKRKKAHIAEHHIVPWEQLTELLQLCGCYILGVSSFGPAMTVSCSALSFKWSRIWSKPSPLI